MSFASFVCFCDKFRTSFVEFRIFPERDAEPWPHTHVFTSDHPIVRDSTVREVETLAFQKLAASNSLNHPRHAVALGNLDHVLTRAHRVCLTCLTISSVVLKLKTFPSRLVDRPPGGRGCRDLGSKLAPLGRPNWHLFGRPN